MTFGANSQTFGYDIVNHLTSAVSGSGGYGTLGWSYDKNGNWLSATAGGGTASYSYTAGTNRMYQESVSGSPIYTLSYLANGNISSISSLGWNFTYNVANRLTAISGSGVSLATTNVYDDAGKRFSMTDSGYPPTFYSYDQTGKLLEENDNGAVTDYIYANGRPIGTFVPVSGGTSGTMYYVHTDRLGTPVLVTNSSQAKVWSRVYSPYGAPDTNTNLGGITQNLRFPGQYAENGGDFFYNLNREYLAAFGRYTQPDPIGLNGGLNPYSYAQGSPTNLIDPWGLICSNDIPGSSDFPDFPFLQDDGGDPTTIPSTPDLWDAFLNGYGSVPGFADILQQNLNILANIYGAGGAGVARSIWNLLQDENGGSPNMLQPIQGASGAHTSWKTDSDGNITNYQTWEPNDNPRNPNAWIPGNRVDLQGKPDYNKATRTFVPTPHVHDRSILGGVRPATPEEIPGGPE